MLVGMYRLSRSQFAEKFIRLKGRPFSLDNYPYFRQPYDDCSVEVLFKAGRQVAKSTTLCNILVSEMGCLPHFQSLYVSPSLTQTRRFSSQRYTPTIKHSPLIQDYFIDSSVLQNVFEKSFTNGSCVNFVHAFADADTIRGISADRVCIDEVQDILWETMPVIRETMAASEYKWIMYAGTPKTFDNTIENLWKGSTQCEWYICCPACRHGNIPSIRNIGETSYVCSKCGKPLDLKSGEWVAINPAASRLGFRIPQIIRPSLDWCDLRRKIDGGEYSEGKIQNEILGEPFDVGVKPITMSDLIACCRDYLPTETKESEYEIARVFGGLDWAVTSGTSVFSAGGPDTDGRFKIIYSKKYTSTDPRAVIEDVVRLCGQLNVEFLGVDRGAGHTNNLMLHDRMQWTKVIEFTYVPRQREGMKWDQKSQCFILDRTFALDSTIYKLKNQKVVFPKYDSFGKTFFPDIVGVFTEYNDYLKKIEYKHPSEIPDDFFHSLTYTLLAHQINTKYSGGRYGV